MEKFDAPKYDVCRKWIQLNYENDVPWEEIKMARKSNMDELIDFLKKRTEEDFWPEFSAEEWITLVCEIEEYESKQQSLKFRGSEGALFDTKQDNGLKIPENERSCWQLYKNSLNWKKDSIDDLEQATVGILRRLSIDTRETGPIKGLVIGHVQSGKTANMEALMAMAADHGWNMFIVLSGSIENLRIQTLRRMQKDLNHEGNLIWRGIEHPSKNSQYGERARDFHFENGAQSRYFTVCLKNTSRLKKLIDWIHADKAAHDLMRILVIDDEADQASISNTATELTKEKRERKGINKLIVNLVEDCHYKDTSLSNGKAIAMNYVMYTATPYANFLNECSEESLYPRHFIWTLKTSDEYIGPNQIYGFPEPESSDGLDISRVVDERELELISRIYDGESDELPCSMKNAICWFICSVAVMRYWGYKKPVSMLIHTSQKQVCHEAIAEAISHWINSIRKNSLEEECKRVYEYEINRITKADWISQLEGYGIQPDIIKNYPEFSEIVSYIDVIIDEDIQHIKMNEEGDLQYHSGLHLVIDNCSKNGIQNENDYVRLAYPDQDSENYPSLAPAFIIVGGSTLSRGLTIEGLVSTFFLRASCQADTLMQMGRWFGYRKGYELLPRLWMTQDTIEKFRFLSQLEVELRDDLKKYMYSDVRPIDYGPRILNSPKVSWLRLTSRNHMKNAVPAEMDFSGAKPQTVIFDNNVDIQRANIAVTEQFLSLLPGMPGISYDKSSLYWKDIGLSLITDSLLLNKFHFSNRSRVFNEISTFCEWIKQIMTTDYLNKWSVIVAGKDDVQNGVVTDSRYWNVAGYSIGKVTRSKRNNSDEFSIDIGALRALKDCVADIDGEVIKNYGNITKQEDVDKIRKACGMDKTPLLIIYRIDGNSKAQENSQTRQDLNMGCDIIGLHICVPGDQLNNKYCKRLTIQIPEKNIEDEVEENS